MNMKNSFINKRSLRFGSYSVVLTVIVIAAAVILNMIVGATQLREKLKIDLTSNKLYSIGEKTDEVLKELDTDVEIIGLFDESQIGSSLYSQVIEFIKQYDSKSNKISVRYVDPEKDPAFIQNELDPEGILGVKKSDFVVRSNKRSKVLSTYDIFEQTFDQNSYSFRVTGLNAEYAFTGAIRYVASENIPVVYYTEGHGEGKLEADYSELKSSIELNGYELKPLNLTAVESVPGDASVILVVSPQQDLSLSEKEKLTIYMENGGGTIFLFDPLQSNAKLQNFEDFLAKFNIGLGYDVVFEMAANRSAYGQPNIFMPYVENNDITANLDPDKLNMTIVNARSVPVLKNVKEWITTTPLLVTSSEAVGKSFEEGAEDTQGPLNIAVAAENKGNAAASKTLVIGNAYLVSDQGLDTTGTGKKFLLNGLNWMQDQQADIYIPVKKYTTPRLEAITQQTLTILFISLIIVVPLIIIGVGVFVWLRRRHL
ncbi:MAG: GldG family protein [Clostridiaceae bacterium]|jgi:hypothetical protein|nr:GldG family protein [Clostridiaceae bacterium]